MRKGRRLIVLIYHFDVIRDGLWAVAESGTGARCRNEKRWFFIRNWMAFPLYASLSSWAQETKPLFV